MKQTSFSKLAYENKKKTTCKERFLGLIHCILPNARIIDARREADGLLFQQFQTVIWRRTELYLWPKRNR